MFPSKRCQKNSVVAKPKMIIFELYFTFKNTQLWEAPTKKCVCTFNNMAIWKLSTVSVSIKNNAVWSPWQQTSFHCSLSANSARYWGGFHKLSLLQFKVNIPAIQESVNWFAVETNFLISILSQRLP